MLTRLSLRKALELVGVDPRAFWGVQPITPDRIFWPTLREAPEGKPTRLEFHHAVGVVENLVLGTDNILITSPTVEPVPGPQAYSAGYPVASWGRRATKAIIIGERLFIGDAELTPVNEMVLIDWINAYQTFVDQLGKKPVLMEVRISCPQCRAAYNVFPIIGYTTDEVSMLVDPWEIISPSAYVDVRGPISPVQANWGTVQVWGYVGTVVEHHGELSQSSIACEPGQSATPLIYSGVERPDIWLRILAGYMPNVCSMSNLFRNWAQIVENITPTAWGATFGAIEAWAMRASIRE